MDYQKQTFSNSLRLVTVPMPSFESVTVLVLVRAGSRYEEKEINGISHFLEHMAFKGTVKRPSALSISSEIDGMGGEANAFTSKDHTGYYIKAAVKNTPILIDILSDILLHSKYEQAEIEKERGVIIEEINMYEDLPMRRVSDLYERLLYGDTKLGRDIAGNKDVIKTLQRQDFISYMDKFYSPANTVVVIAGGIDKIANIKYQISNIIEKYFGKWEKKQVEPPEKAEDKQEKPALLLYFKDTEQAHLCLGVRSYNIFHPDRYALAVLTAILGGGMSSRLFTEVREKRGLAYYVRTSNEMYTDVGNFVSQAGVDQDRIDEAIKVILEEYRKIADKGVGEEELTKAKEYSKGRFTLELEDSKSVASLFATSLLLEGKIRTPKEIMGNVDRVTSADVQRVAKDIFRTEKLNLAIIGKYKQEERFFKILNL